MKPKDLMELVDECVVLDDPGWNGKEIPEAVEGLQDLGFVAALSGWEEANPDHKKSKLQRIFELEYKTITNEAIKKFLKRKATIYDAEHKPKIEKPGNDHNFFSAVDPNGAISLLSRVLREQYTQNLFFSKFVHKGIETTEIPESESEVFTIETLEAAKEKMSAIQPIAIDREISETQQAMRLGQQMQQESSVSPELMGMAQNAESAQMQENRVRSAAVNMIAHPRPLGRGLINGEPITTALLESPLDGMDYMRQDYYDDTEAMPTFVERTCDYHLTKEGTIGKFEWTEVPVKDYKGLPPAKVLKTFTEHMKRNIFDYFTIAFVEGIPDPILFGRLNGERTKRWFIENWGSDISLDDLI